MDTYEIYKEALRRAKIWQKHLYEVGDKDYADELNYIFPELKESEDEKIRKEIIDFLWKEKIFLQEAHSSVENNPKYRFVMDAIAWLEKQGEQKPAWNEEDDKWIESLIQTIEDGYLEGFNQLKSYGVISWLKSIKGRYTWKPSDEQMQCLLSEVEGWTKGCPKQKVLESLYNDLKKLKGG